MLKHKNSKFLFYNVNDWLNGINQLVRHTKMSYGHFPLSVLQEKNWVYFIEIILEISENDSLELESLGTAVDIDENKLIIDSMTSLSILKHFYKTLYNTVANNHCEFL